MRTAFAVTVAAILVGCAASRTGPILGALREGMPRAEVISRAGEPTTTTFRDGDETFVYEIGRGDDVVVKLRDGRVVAYGPARHFKVRNPTLDVNIGRRWPWSD